MTDASPPPRGAIVYEVREQIAGALLPVHDYAVTGSCATGTGLEPASLYAQGGSGRGAGMGAGLGGRLGYLWAPTPPTPGRPTWWGVRVASGLDLDMLYARIDTGLPDVSGHLCERVKTDGVGVQYEGSTVLLAQLSASIGAQLGFGAMEGQDESWHGLVLGAAIVPALTYVKPWVTGSSLDGSFLGTELTLDFASLAKGTMHESAKRAAIFLLLPPQNRGPVVVTVSFGIVWS